MNNIIEASDVVAVIKYFLKMNEGDEATEDIILAIGAEILDISIDTMCEITN